MPYSATPTTSRDLGDGDLSSLAISAPGPDEVVAVETEIRPAPARRLRPGSAIGPELVPTPHTLLGARFKVFVVGVLVTVAATLLVVQHVVWPHSVAPTGALRYLRWLSVGWVVSIVPAGVSIAGMLLQRNPRADVQIERRLKNTVCFRFVSRGVNVDTLREAVLSVHTVMGQYPLFPYLVEVVVENDIELPSNRRTRIIRVPAEFTTQSGAVFKARGLQYALESSPLAESAWILYCDEESHVTASLVRGIWEAVTEEEASGEYRIGQGAILYHHTLDDHPFLTLADNIRSGDDIGRWHLQNRIVQRPLWGFHGSFILVRNSVAAEVDFEFGPEGSITEDAFWALRQWSNGRRCRWVDGFMVEQSPERAADFFRQRRRWFAGLRKTVRHAPVPRLYRLPLAMFMGIWSLGWLGVAFNFVNLFLGTSTWPAVQVLADVASASFVTIYLVGLRVNLAFAETSRLRRLALYCAQVVLVPVFGVMESISVVYGIFRPERGFYVIQKTH